MTSKKSIVILLSISSAHINHNILNQGNNCSQSSYHIGHCCPGKGIFSFWIFFSIGNIGMFQPGKALRLASNSTGRVTSENSTVTAKSAIPTKSKVELPEAAIKTPIKNPVNNVEAELNRRNQLTSKVQPGISSAC